MEAQIRTTEELKSSQTGCATIAHTQEKTLGNLRIAFLRAIEVCQMWISVTPFIIHSFWRTIYCFCVLTVHCRGCQVSACRLGVEPSRAGTRLFEWCLLLVWSLLNLVWVKSKGLELPSSLIRGTLSLRHATFFPFDWAVGWALMMGASIV